MSESDVEKKLAALRLVFKQQLPNKIAEVERLSNSLAQDITNTTILADTSRLAHSLTGSAATLDEVLYEKE